ncbi:MAG TPA: hypothetical protein V6D48_24085 [Oculatellaceae cyanobacterium]
MNPDAVWVAEKIVEGIISWHIKDYNPLRLSGNMLSLFQKFKGSYDSKDLTQLSRVISDSYSGSLYEAKTKFAFIQLFKQTFNALPKFAYPSLTINIYQITEDSDKAFGAIVEFKSHVKVAFVPVASIDSGQVYVEARPEGEYRMWRITRIDTIRD